MEIEAKFSVPDKDTFDIFQNIPTVGQFKLNTVVETTLEDTYLDAVDMIIMSEGYYLRRRKKGQNIIYTLKSLGGSGKDGIRRREEMECILAHDKPLEEWEESHIKNFISQLVDSNSLTPLFKVDHLRYNRKISDTETGKEVAELSLDDVKISAAGKYTAYQEIEVELLLGADQTELEALASTFKDEFGLIPGSLSKFEHGVMLLNGADNELVTEKKYDTTPMPIQLLFKKYHIDRGHARKVTENALKLFDELKSIHGLGDEYRRVTWICSLLHDIGMYTDIQNHHKSGRDILMQSPPTELPEKFWSAAVWTTFLHKKKITQNKLDKLNDKSFGNLPEEIQKDILKIAALIRIADGLDYSRMHSDLHKISVDDYSVMIMVKGPGASIDADRADTKSDLWRLIFDQMIEFRAES
ncbi:CYTH domain-containing protein [uncultured Methanomethylovorans sp.]|uniref:CYTH domain-containing protein n=1 Tax=uncultured Methanomethylovorans sp. TaxID=183759 RepID=UPI002AA7ADDF|nr:CYTH domain-containing protein [uncultured Methanomethylovorans sp.]